MAVYILLLRIQYRVHDLLYIPVVTCQFTVTVGDVGSILFFRFYILGLFSLVMYVLVICGHKMIMTSNQAGFIILKIYH